MLEFIAVAFIAPIIGTITPKNFKKLKKKFTKARKHGKSYDKNIDINGTKKNFYFSLIAGAVFMVAALVNEILFRDIILVESITTRFLTFIFVLFAFMYFSVSQMAFNEAIEYRERKSAIKNADKERKNKK